ncbi:hypothetical protein GCM10009628_02800 [Paeniglutamicibacter kerguelensis]|uniref:Uncharacterized protein n=1 Tax=Paeniglutamicibacter kerguelensis TaxID=254788 RepID=A0ABS4XHB1_9MICC|nr:hypothetical protein [Paeniglutamicibacter kerguelensis]
MLLSPGKKAVRVELHVGSRNVFVDAGFTEVDHFTLRRVVARIVFTMPRPVLTCNAMPWHMESIGLPSRVITTSCKVRVMRAPAGSKMHSPASWTRPVLKPLTGESGYDASIAAATYRGNTHDGPDADAARDHDKRTGGATNRDHRRLRHILAQPRG